MRPSRVASIVASLCLLVPLSVEANVGVPMLVLAWPAQWLSLVFIIAIECSIVARGLGIALRTVLWPVTRANLLSTLVGVPVAWFAMLALEYFLEIGVMGVLPQAVTESKAFRYASFPFMAAWVADENPWEVYLAFLVLVVPFCAVSIWVERRDLASLVDSSGGEKLRTLVWRANILSYAFLSLAALAFPLTS